MEVKPGYKTTEFWITLVCQILGILALTGVLTKDQSDALTTVVTQVSGCILAALSSFGYSISRGRAKG